MSATNSAIDLLKLGDAEREKPLLSILPVWPNVVGVFFGVGCGVIQNFATRRPYFSGIQKHIAYTAGWCAVLNYIYQRRLDYYAEKDAVFRHYIELHPEDFPEKQFPLIFFQFYLSKATLTKRFDIARQKIGQIFEPWTPIR